MIENIKWIPVFLFQILSLNSYSQGIINTESSLREINNGFNFSSNLEGDIQTGNVDIIEVNSSIIFSYKLDKILIRLINGYEYLEEDKLVESNDVSSHFRMNHFTSNNKFNSIYFFFQIQSAKSINQISRILRGAGYRFRLFNKSKDYFDISTGYFLEIEKYDYLNQETKVKNNRLSLNNFFFFRITNKLSIDGVTYFQLNLKNRDDFRLFFEPKLIFNIDKAISFYLRFSNKYHSSPYINIFKRDRDLLIGLELNLN